VFPYDRLLIATGASPVMPEVEGIETEGVMPLKRLADGRRIKDFLAVNSVRSIVIVGMGYIGLEMSEALRSRDLAVTGLSRGFMTGYDPQIADVVRQTLIDHGVILQENHVLGKSKKRGGSWP